MILLSGHSLTPARKVPLEALSLKLTERDSTAAMTPADMTGIDSNSWFQDETAPGQGIVWRVRSIQQAYATRTPTVQLEHAIGTLKDRILFGEIKPENISGGSTCTAKQAIEYALARQSDWVLGTFGYSVSNPYKFDSDTIYDAIVKVSASLTDAWWSYDFSTYPFKLNITPRQSGVACELRPGRNLTAISKTVDRSGMYTRFYPIGKEDLHVPGDYISKNESAYGAICHVETDQSLESVAELTAWANEKLDRHAEPRVTISADGVELSRATGESMDSLTLGRICRIPLTEFGTTIEERIVELSYTDKVHQPELVKVTMANAREDVTKILADTIKQVAGGGGGRAGARQQKEDHAWIEDTDEYVALVAEKTGIDGLGEDETLYSRIQVEAGRITSEVVRATGAEANMASRITQTESAITAEVTRATEAEGSLTGQISVEAGKISQIVSAVGSNGEVTAASIVLAINANGSGAYINADHVYISGTTRINDIFYVSGDAIGVAAPMVTNNTITAPTFRLLGLSPISLTADNMQKAIKEAKVEGSGSNMTLKLIAFDGSEVNFTKASTTSLTESWSGGKITVTAQPGGLTLERSLATGTPTWNGNLCTVPVNATWGSSGQYSESTGWSVSVNAQARYNAGYDSAHLSGGWGTGSNSNLFTVTKVQSGSSNSLTCRVTAGISYNSSTHKYTATAYGNSASKATTESGTEAYDAGYGSAHLSGAWGSGSDANLFTVSKVQSGSSNSLTVRVTSGISYNTSTHKYTATAYGNQASKATSVSGTEAYDAGKASVTIPTNTAPAGTAESATITATATNGATKTCTVTADSSGWSDGGTYVQVKMGSTVIARKWVYLPAYATWSSYWFSSSGVSVTCNVGGQSYTQSFIR